MLLALLLPIYVPAGLTTTANTLLVPFLPVWLRGLGAPDAMVGAFFSFQGLGATVAGPPSGIAVASIGLKTSMISALCTVAVICALCAVVEWIWLLLLLRALLGASLSLYQVSRQTHIAATVPNRMRGTASSMLGGSMRIVSVVGPLLGGGIVASISVSAAFWLQALLYALTAMLVSRAIASPSADEAAAAAAAATKKKERGGLCVAVRSDEARRALLRAAPTALAISLARAARSMMLPLRAADAGLSDAGLGGVIAASFAFDMALFPVAGYIMDHCGRKYAGVPSMMGFSLSFVVLASAATPAAVWAASILMGVSNGLTSGFLQVLGADLAPEGAQSEFLGLWKSVTSGGNLVGPLAIGLISQSFGGLGSSAACIAALCACGAAWYSLVGEETLQRGVKPGPAASLAAADSANEPDMSLQPSRDKA